MGKAFLEEIRFKPALKNGKDFWASDSGSKEKEDPGA